MPTATMDPLRNSGGSWKNAPDIEPTPTVAAIRAPINRYGLDVAAPAMIPAAASSKGRAECHCRSIFLSEWAAQATAANNVTTAGNAVSNAMVQVEYWLPLPAESCLRIRGMKKMRT